MRFHVFFLIVAGLAILYYSIDASGVFEFIVGDKPIITDSAIVIKNAGVNP